MIQLKREELLKLNDDLRKQLANERKEIVDLRLENYSLKTRIKRLIKTIIFDMGIVKRK